MKKGLSLGAGGVKGFVHLGVLQYLYEQEIKFDLVSGSSIGSIMGAMYALGFTPSKMMSECIKIGFSDVQKLIGYRFVKNGLSGLIDQLLGGKSFEDTLIPFKAVAVNMFTGEQKNFSTGNLGVATACSSAIPPYLRPVKIEEGTFVDGAFIDSVPADVVKEMGADKILSVNLSYASPFNYSNKSYLDKLYPKNKVERADVTYQCYTYSDVIIEPDLKKYKAFGFKGFEEMFDIGYEEAKKNKDKLEIFR